MWVHTGRILVSAHTGDHWRVISKQVSLGGEVCWMLAIHT